MHKKQMRTSARDRPDPSDRPTDASRRLLAFAVALAAAALAFSVVVPYLFVRPPARVAEGARWIGLAALLWYGTRRRSLTAWILVAMVVGAEIGHDFPEFAVRLRVFSLIFLRLIRTIIAPLIFGTLVVGIAGHSNLKQVGRMGVKSLIYFEVVTTLAMLIGLGAINLTKAGRGIKAAPAAAVMEQAPPQKETASDVILRVFPENVAKSIADGQVLQVVVFSILFAVALAMVGETKRQPMLRFAESLSETMFKFTNIVMLMAPIGVGAAIAATVGHMGLGVLANLAKLLGTLYIALAVFALFVLLPIAMAARIPVRSFIRLVTEPASIAFATTSSEAALPKAMEAMVALGVPEKIVAFVIPTGYSFNLDGSVLYLSLASIFVAQAAGIHLGFWRQVVMLLALMLTSKGIAGVPRASLVILLATASSFNLPVEPVFIVMGIDELMDMGRTSINVVGNCLASAVIARWEGELGQQSAESTVSTITQAAAT